MESWRWDDARRSLTAPAGMKRVPKLTIGRAASMPASSSTSTTATTAGCGFRATNGRCGLGAAAGAGGSTTTTAVFFFLGLSASRSSGEMRPNSARTGTAALPAEGGLPAPSSRETELGARSSHLPADERSRAKNAPSGSVDDPAAYEEVSAASPTCRNTSAALVTSCPN